MLSDQMRTVDPDALALRTLHYLATQVSNRPMMHSLVRRDVERWNEMDKLERQQVVSRSIRRVGSVCPWVRSKDSVRQIADAYGCR